MKNIKKRLSRYGVTPNMWVFPPKMAIYASMVPPEKTTYPLAGVKGQATFEAGPSALGSFRGVNVYETRLFDVYENELPIDLLRRQAQVGEYYVMTNPYDADAKGYDPKHRDIVIYNEGIDNWTKVSFDAALRNAINVNDSGYILGTNENTDDQTVGSKYYVTNLSKGRSNTRISDDQIVERHKIPQFMLDRLDNVSAHYFDNVQPASDSAYVSKDGLLGVYASAISSTGKVGKADPGDTEALFSKHHTKESHWAKASTVKKILSDLKSSSSTGQEVTFANLVKECEAFVAEKKRVPTRNVSSKTGRNVSSVGDYGARRQKSSDELLEDILEQKYQQVGWNTDTDFELQYANEFLIGAKRGQVVEHQNIFAKLDNESGNPDLDVILFRPWMTYEMSSAILTKSGYETGATFVGHSDFLLGDDVISKLHYGNFTFYSKAVVTNPRNVIIARNIFCNSYVGGNDCGFIRVKKVGNKEKNYSPQTGDHGGSLIAVALPGGTCAQIQKNPIDMRGYFTGYEDDGDRSTSRHYATPSICDAVKRALQLDTVDPGGAPGVNLWSTQLRKQNTVCYRGHQFSYDVNSKKFSNITVNTGHWGPNVYAGCGRVRAGDMKYLKEQNYKQSIDF